MIISRPLLLVNRVTQRITTPQLSVYIIRIHLSLSVRLVTHSKWVRDLPKLDDIQTIDAERIKKLRPNLKWGVKRLTYNTQTNKV